MAEVLSKDETLQKRTQLIGTSCTLFFRSDPIKIVRARETYMYDEEGNEYLDCINNVCHVGHCHPEVVSAGTKQMAVLNTNSRFLHDNLVLYAEKLVSLFPKPLEVCFITNSGSEANDLAIRLARAHTRSRDIIVLDHAYHGHLISLIDISPIKFSLPGADGKPDHVHVVPCPDDYRGKYTRLEHSPEELGRKYADEVGKILKDMKKKQKKPCAFFAESMLSCGGQIVLPPGFLRESYKLVREAGGICVADEVQVGFGRVGTHWWGFQLQGGDIIPDIVTIGKPIGNGHPLSAVITTREVANSFAATGVEYFNTFGGNPVSCAIGLAVIDAIEKENLMDNCVVVGERLMTSLRELQQRHDIVGDVRGVGLFVGVDLVKSRQSREPATAEAQHVISRLKDKFILLSAEGPHRNVLKFKPPVVFSVKDVDRVVQALDQVLTDLENSKMALERAVNGYDEERNDTQSHQTK